MTPRQRQGTARSRQALSTQMPPQMPRQVHLHVGHLVLADAALAAQGGAHFGTSLAQAVAARLTQRPGFAAAQQAPSAIEQVAAAVTTQVQSAAAKAGPQGPVRP